MAFLREPKKSLPRLTVVWDRHGIHSKARLVKAFLAPPLYRTAFASGLGTLYTAIYSPATGRVEYRWPNHRTVQSFSRCEDPRKPYPFGNP